jgi:hypothetical protein
VKHHESIEWRDIWVSGADTERWPRLLLVGDSIARSYFSHVEKELKDVYLCARLTSSTCVCDRAMEQELKLLLDDYRFAVVHFNNGLHGWDYGEKEYGQGLRRVLSFIAGRSPHSQLILATTTPIRRTDKPGELDPRTERVRDRNRLAREIAEKCRLPLNDLFDAVLDHPEYVGPDGVHFNPVGEAALGRQVAETVLKYGGQHAEQRRP